MAEGNWKLMLLSVLDTRVFLSVL
uniref:Uncharacterized protein n=1 Tax=Arundo donax TaxID=35708 RepID=A0A0A9HDH1_ARUDO